MPAGPPIIAFTPLQSRDGTLNKDPLSKNAFVEAQGQELHVVKRPCLALYDSAGSGPGQGIADFVDVDGSERLVMVDGGSLKLGNGFSPATSWTNVAEGPVIASQSNEVLLHCATVSFGGVLWLVGTDLSATRFCVYSSTDQGVTWSTLLDVAGDGSSYPNAISAQGACIVHTYSGTKRVLYFNTLVTGAVEVWKSTDMLNWTKISSDCLGAVITFGQCIEHASALYLLTYQSSVQNTLRKSTDGGATWTEVLAGNVPKTGQVISTTALVSLGGTIYAIGGIQGASTYQQSVWSGGADGSAWSEVGTNVLPEAMTVMQAMVIAGVCYIIGYRTSASNNTFKVYYSTDMTTWTLMITWTGDPAVLSSFDEGILKWWGNAAGPKLAFHKGAIFCGPRAVTGSGSGDQSILKLAQGATPQQVTLDNVGPGFFDFAQTYDRTQIAAKSEYALYTLTVATSVVTQVTDVDYPALTVRGAPTLDDYLFAMTPDGDIYNSDNGDFTSWGALNFVAAQFENDGGVALSKIGLYIVALGIFTTELFYNAGNASGSPLSPVQQGVYTVGCAHAYSVQQFGSRLVWLAQGKGSGQSRMKGRFIALMEEGGGGPQKISTSDIDRILEADTLGTVHSTAFTVAGHTFYHLMLYDSGISLVFDFTSQQWHWWSTRRTSSTISPASVVTTAGTATATLTHGMNDGDVMVVSGFTGTDTNLNGTFNARVASSTLLHWLPSDTTYAGTATETGTATIWAAEIFPTVGAANIGTKQIMQDISNGSLYSLDFSTYQDNSIWCDFLVRLGKNNFGFHAPKFMAWADFLCNRNSGNLLYRHSDDDCQNFIKWKWKTMDQVRTRFSRLGKFHDRVMEYRVTDNIPARVRGINVDLQRAQ